MKCPFIHEADYHTAGRGIGGANWDSKALGKNHPIYLPMAVLNIERNNSIELFE
jgi:hypothetical protein